MRRGGVGRLGLLRRIANPSLTDQDQGSLCGPAALMFNYASDKPGHFARFAIDLYQKGQANLGRLLIKPGKDVRHFLPPSTLDHVDWLTCASLRDSENWFLDFDDTGKISDIAGMTLPSEMEQWFRKAGYRDVRENANISQLNKGMAAVNEANLLLENGYRVCLLISANMTDYDDQSDKGWGTSKHWLVLREKIQVTDGHVKTKVFTWGKGTYEIPHPHRDTGQVKPLPVGDFLQNFYGYVAAKA
jgi:hypothetical protein